MRGLKKKCSHVVRLVLEDHMGVGANIRQKTGYMQMCARMQSYTARWVSIAREGFEALFAALWELYVVAEPCLIMLLAWHFLDAVMLLPVLQIYPLPWSHSWAQPSIHDL